MSNVKFSTCKYCGSNNVMWEQHNGKFVLFDSHGLPHSCEQGEKFFKEKQQAESERKKKLYADEKTRLQSLVGTKCSVCVGGILPGIHFHNSPAPIYCRECDGRGNITDRVVEMKLFYMRKQLWPTMFSKQKRE